MMEHLGDPASSFVLADWAAAASNQIQQCLASSSSSALLESSSTTMVAAASSTTTAIEAAIQQTQQQIMTMTSSSSDAMMNNMEHLDHLQEEKFLSSLGHDVLIFLASTVVVVPLSRALNITPVLGFLAAGFLLGPNSLALFSNNEADLELGDFGILFLLFAEGLNLSPSRVKQLGQFGKLGVAQLLASMALLFTSLLVAGPYIVRWLTMYWGEMDEFGVAELFNSPSQAFCIAAAGALSSSAFVLPILKEKKWDDKPEGIAALAVLLLQDLAVAPLLVVLPLVAGAGPQTSAEFGTLVAKATLGFGSVLYLGSLALKQAFDVVAATRSTETFVAAALLVAVGMGNAAEWMGLSSTTGAFAAGVLLANNKYRAQIKADVQPFEGLLLGIFFMTAGGSLDPAVILSDIPTLMAGIVGFIVIKAFVLYLAAPALGKTKAQAARVAILLAGGGEFSLVLLNLARDLGVVPMQLSKLLAASIVISMSLTPLLGEIAAWAGDYLERQDDNFENGNVMNGGSSMSLKRDVARELFDQIDVDGSGTIECEELRAALVEKGLSYSSVAEIFDAFDAQDGGSITRDEWYAGLEKGYLAAAISHSPGALEETKRLQVKVAEDAFVICGYTEFGRELYRVLEASGCAENGGLVAFDLNPSRVAAGLLAGVNVVYGNGASPVLLRSAGVKKPKGVVVAFRSESNRLEATARLREGLPPGTPIYARVVSGQSVTRKDLIDVGATEVVNERIESALQFAVLLGGIPTNGNDKSSLEFSGLRGMLMNIDHSSEEPSFIPGFSEDRIFDLCEEYNCSRDSLSRLYSVFSSLPEDGGDQFVPIEELAEVLMRRSEVPIDDEQLEKWKEMANFDGSGVLSFVDFARSYYAIKGGSPAWKEVSTSSAETQSSKRQT